MNSRWWNFISLNLQEEVANNKFKVYVFNHFNSVQAEWLIEKEISDDYCLILNNTEMCGYKLDECRSKARENKTYCKIAQQ